MFLYSSYDVNYDTQTTKKVLYVKILLKQSWILWGKCSIYIVPGIYFFIIIVMLIRGAITNHWFNDA